MRFSVASTRTGRTTPSNYLHKQLDVTLSAGAQAVQKEKTLFFKTELYFGTPWLP